MDQNHAGKRGASYLLMFFLFTTLMANTTAATDLSAACYTLPPLSGMQAAADKEAENAFCAIDFASASVAICPKTWSTSPAALVYDLGGTSWEGRASQFESDICAVGGHAREQARSELAIFKNSLNGRETSGTFAPASLLYYHFSRLLQTRIQVPVAVLVEFPVDQYKQRVVSPGLKDTNSKRLKMLHAGWQEMDLALSDPAGYAHRRELFTSDNETLWGVFLLEEGRRYGPEINGTRASGWGDGQNKDFQRTPPFLALRADLPLDEAVSAGLVEAKADAAMAKALQEQITAAQVAWWMHEITEIVILDTILRQQDRVGNIDYQWRWQWLEQGELRVSGTKPEVERAMRMRVSLLNDNDAGVRSGYANYASRTAMLDGWHHMDPGLYQRLQQLAADFASSGPVASAVRENYRLSSREAEGIIKRGVEVAAKLRERCEAGELRFDLTLAAVMDPSRARAEPASCHPVPLHAHHGPGLVPGQRE